MDKTHHQPHSDILDSDAQLWSLINNTPVVLFALDAEGTFLLSEGKGLETLGLEQGEVVGTSVFEIYDDPDIVRDVRRALAGASFTSTIEFDGATFECRYRPVLDDEKNVERVLAVAVDVTERTQYQEMLTTLHSSTRDLLDAETKQAVADRIVEGATEVLNLTGVVVFLFDESSNQLQPVAFSPDVPPFVGVPPSYRPGSSITWHVFAEGESKVFGDVRESEYIDNPDTQVRSGLYIPLGSQGVLVAISPEPDAFSEQTVELVDLFATNAEAALDRVDRESELRERDQELQRQNEQLGQLNELNGTIRELVQRLVRATTREEIERAVCERLTTVDRYGFAWVGDPDITRDELVPRTWGGSDHSYLDSVSLSLSGDESAEPACTAAQRRELVVVDNVADDLRTASWRKEALSRDYQSILAVPLVYEEFLYGVLTVYAQRLDAFDDTTRAVFAELGETIGYAINAVETKRGVLTDGTLELDLRLSETDDLLARVAEQTSCRLELEGVVPEPDSTVLFVTVSDADVQSVLKAFEELVAVRAVRLVTERDDEALIEIVATGETLAGTFTKHGAVPKSIVATPEELTAIVQVAYDTDVRAFIEMLRTNYPDAELVARRDRRQTSDSEQTFAAKLSERLTDRQAEVMRAAYLGGFFESPRASTGEEIGASLNITQPTFNHHLRTGQRKLFELLYGEDATIHLDR
ncbi:PAS domain S-box-containing protein [Halogranum amylolyticum]|uniref:PAS domain S-box-containing protein n=1 Tax=Halogranum amylolyticum TaxID=660520 RepID=A0A1H8W366_9EURY|nr:bacterio-opsin activator domain-containing protein [Halogranum amylolyticum]SEP21973.1 PAS domain S-box-containing protein [Halogranum amylolyticum]